MSKVSELVARAFDPGRSAAEADRRAQEQQERDDALAERRRKFDVPLEKAVRRDALKVPYETRWLRAVVDTIRLQMEAYDAIARAKPMDEAAHEMTARRAALVDLEGALLDSVDEANEGEGEGE